MSATNTFTMEPDGTYSGVHIDTKTPRFLEGETTEQYLKRIRLSQEPRMDVAKERCNNLNVSLDLSGLGLETLPPIPPIVTELNVARNKLTALPLDLPPMLRLLNCCDNDITELPESLPNTL